MNSFLGIFRTRREWAKVRDALFLLRHHTFSRTTFNIVFVARECRKQWQLSDLLSTELRVCTLLIRLMSSRFSTRASQWNWICHRCMQSAWFGSDAKELRSKCGWIVCTHRMKIDETRRKMNENTKSNLSELPMNYSLWFLSSVLFHFSVKNQLNFSRSKRNGKFDFPNEPTTRQPPHNWCSL